MSQFPQQPIQSMTQFHGCCNFTGLDIDEWLKDEDEQFAKIERYEAALKNAQAVAAPEKFLAPRGNVLDGFLHFLEPHGNVLEGFLANHGNVLDGFLAPHGNVLEGFLAPQGNVPEGFLAPQGNVPQQVLDHVPAKSGPINVPGYSKLNNIALSSDFHESSILAVPKKHFRWTREEQRLLGNWKEVSNFVGSNTSSQVASHAEKYSDHKKEPEKKRKNKSIHDTTLKDTDMNMILLPHIDRQNWVSIPNFAMPQPSDLDLVVQQFYKRQ